ncbi:MAG: DUF58 domain-containing protein [Desulfosarcinaceae bacterium]|nr:DUF58 domain-containing protein [Desulfosarcinaceae bacterium]
MLSPEIIAKIKKVHIKSGRQVNTLMAGQYRSVFRGSGIEFEEVREYTPGDEVKRIDWKVSARLGRPFVKRYREERELIVMLLIDLSASNRFGTTQATKRDTIAEAAAILAFNAIRNNDKVGAILFTDQVEHYIPPKKGSAHVWRVLREIFSFRPTGRGTDIGTAVGFLGRVCRKQSVSFLISDFIVPAMDDALRRRLRSGGRRHELIALMVSDPGEVVLPRGGLVALADLESGRQLTFDAADPRSRAAFARLQQDARRATKDQLASLKMDTVDLSTAGDAADALVRYFRIRERRKR